MVNLKYNGWIDEYFSTAGGDDRPGNSTNYGLRAWWRPADSGSATPEVSFGYDYSVVDGYSTNDTTDMFFVGLTWLDTFNPDDRLGIAFGQPQMRENTGAEPFMYEVYYGFKVNDSITVTPAIFGATNANGTDGEDYTCLLYTSPSPRDPL